MPVLKFKKLHPEAIVPEYQTRNSSGFDFHAIVEAGDGNYQPGNISATSTEGGSMTLKSCLVVPPKSQCVVRTGLAVSIPIGYGIQIRPRSGLAKRKCITLTNSPGTIDADFFDCIQIILFNLGEEDFHIYHGDRIAQGVLERIEQAEIEEIEDFSDQEKEKDRGGGFGSTGIGIGEMTV